MRVSEYSVGHGREGFCLHLGHTSLTRLVLTRLLDMVPAYLTARYAWAYRPWSWAICKLDGETAGWVPISKATARTLSPTFVDEVLDVFGDDLEPDGSIPRSQWS